MYIHSEHIVSAKSSIETWFSLLTMVKFHMVINAEESSDNSSLSKYTELPNSQHLGWVFLLPPCIELLILFFCGQKPIEIHKYQVYKSQLREDFKFPLRISGN